jgi:hypothetical protein
MLIWSHRDSVSGVAHSASREVSNAQAESGTGPSPTMLKANAKMSDLRTKFTLTDLPVFRSSYPHNILSSLPKVESDLCHCVQ